MHVDEVTGSTKLVSKCLEIRLHKMDYIQLSSYSFSNNAASSAYCLASEYEK
jgi:hypothetical protein